MGQTHWIVLISLLTGIFSCLYRPPTDAGRETAELLIIYTGNTLGELKPCGCDKEEDQGGIERRMSYLKDTRQRNERIFLVSTGDNFKEPTRQGKLKALYFMESLTRMDYDAVMLGEHDLVYGNEFLRERRDIPWISGNLQLKDLPLPKFVIKQFENGLKAAVIAVGDPDLFYIQGHTEFKISDPKETVPALIKELRQTENPDLVILLSHMPKERGLELLGLDGVDIVINGHIETDTDVIDMNPVERNGKMFVQPGPRGQKMGELKVRLGPDRNKTYVQKMVRLDSSVKIDDEMVKLYEAYNEEVEELFLASLKQRRGKSKNRVFATEQKCLACHPGKHKVWSQTRHGHAYATLRKVNKAFDPECLGCHVTGFNQPGGFISELDTPELENVQCEVCHGPGLQHARSPGPGFGGNAGEVCKQCHVKNHSPRFDYSTYWPKIKH